MRGSCKYFEIARVSSMRLPTYVYISPLLGCYLLAITVKCVIYGDSHNKHVILTQLVGMLLLKNISITKFLLTQKQPKCSKSKALDWSMIVPQSYYFSNSLNDNCVPTID